MLASHGTEKELRGNAQDNRTDPPDGEALLCPIGTRTQ